MAFDSRGNYYIADDGSNTVRRVDGLTGIISTYAGSYTTIGGFSGDNGPATLGTFFYPSGIGLDSHDNLYISDYYNDVVRRVDATTGILTTVVGKYNSYGFSGDGMPATLAQLNAPIGLRFDRFDNLYIADSNNNVVRRVDGNTHIITTVAGNGTPGYSGDGMPATQAQLNGCEMVALDPSGNLYISDFHNNVFRMVSASTGLIHTIAGSGVTGYSGDNGPATLARFNFDTGAMTVACNGNLIMTDDGNNVVRELDTATGIIKTVAGSATPGFSGEGGPATLAEFNHTQSVGFDPNGNLYILDYANNRVRKVSPFCPPTPTVTFTPTVTPTPRPCGDSLVTYAYPDPATGDTLNFLIQFCEGATGTLRVYDASARLIQSLPLSGIAGDNVFQMDMTGYVRGIYYYQVQLEGRSGTHTSKTQKFAVVRLH